MVAKDKRSQPRVGERLPYVVTHGPPGVPLFNLVRSPHDVINDVGLRLHDVYYITKLILPALDRVFSLLDVDVFQWYKETPRPNIKKTYGSLVSDKNKKVTMM